jgi:hypothetical protein
VLIDLTDEIELDSANRQVDDSGSTRTSAKESRGIIHDSDFGDGANDLWSLYGKEAAGQDVAIMGDIKDNMDSSLIFVCSYSPSRLQA